MTNAGGEGHEDNEDDDDIVNCGTMSIDDT